MTEMNMEEFMAQVKKSPKHEQLKIGMIAAFGVIVRSNDQPELQFDALCAAVDFFDLATRQSVIRDLVKGGADDLDRGIAERSLNAGEADKLARLFLTMDDLANKMPVNAKRIILVNLLEALKDKAVKEGRNDANTGQA